MTPLIRLTQRMDAANSLLCVGLDSDYEKLPARFKNLEYPQFEFNKWIIDQTHQYVCAYKPNIAFYEARGDQGMRELKLTMEYIQQKHADIFTICDAKRADIGSTNAGYVTAIFDWLGFDAVTINPYLGKEAVQPFLDRKDKISIVLCRTSNPGAGELQDLLLRHPEPGNKFLAESREEKPSYSGSGEAFLPLWQVVAEKVTNEWNTNNNCMLVVGATYPEEMQKVRSISGEMSFLVPGIGAQGGEVEAIMKVGLNAHKKGMIINSARGIIFASDPAKEAQTLQFHINRYR